MTLAVYDQTAPRKTPPMEIKKSAEVIRALFRNDRIR